jgi:hypothetical protein
MSDPPVQPSKPGQAIGLLAGGFVTGSDKRIACSELLSRSVESLVYLCTVDVLEHLRDGLIRLHAASVTRFSRVAFGHPRNELAEALDADGQEQLQF